MLSDILDLIKIRILLSSLLTTVLGYAVGLPEGTAFSFLQLLLLLMGCGLLFSAASILNHFLERDVDSLMDRTKNRPLVKERVPLSTVLWMLVFCLVVGSILLLLNFNVLVFLISLLVFVLYVFVYTPLKRLSSTNTIVGAVPGAMPILCGWAVYNQSMNLFIWLLFAIFYFWQLPHFYAIAWMYKENYERAGLLMISNGDDSGSKTTVALIVSTILFLLSTILPVYYGFLGMIYLIFVLLLGAYLLKTVLLFINDRSIKQAKVILRATIFYPPVILLSIMLDLLL